MAALEPHDEDRLDRLLLAFEPPSQRRTGDPEALERGWGVTLPGSFHEVIRRFDGGTFKGTGGVLSLWNTAESLALEHEKYRPILSTPGARMMFFGSDGGSYEVFFDVDDHFGAGEYAVLAADAASDRTEFVGPSFYAALERIVSGPHRGDGDELKHHRPPGSQRR